MKPYSAFEHAKMGKFLFGHHYTLRRPTDRPLTLFLKKHWPERQSAKFVSWNDRLAQFDSHVQYHPGVQNDDAEFFVKAHMSNEETFEDRQHQNLLIRRMSEDIFFDIKREATA